jgi:Tfp pilus assembly protein PilO
MAPNLDRNARKVFLALAAAVSIFLFWVCILQQQWAQFQSLNTGLREAEAALEKGRAIPESLSALEAAATDAEARLLKTESRFNRDLRDGSVLVDIGIEATRAGVSVQSLSPGAVTKKEHYLELLLHIKVRGDYSGVLEFFRSVENLAGASEIRGLEVKTLPLAADGVIQADFTLVLYAAPTTDSVSKPEVIDQWGVGRQNVFDAKGTAAPYPY